MKKMIGRLMAMCLVAVSLAAFAQSGDNMKQDSMKHEDMKQDQMNNEQMKKDEMKIRQIRGFELNQSELAEILGITQAQLSKYEAGLSAPTLEILLKLKAHSNKSVDWILTGE